MVLVEAQVPFTRKINIILTKIDKLSLEKLHSIYEYEFDNRVFMIESMAHSRKQYS